MAGGRYPEPRSLEVRARQRTVEEQRRLHWTLADSPWLKNKVSSEPYVFLLRSAKRKNPRCRRRGARIPEGWCGPVPEGGAGDHPAERGGPGRGGPT